AIAIGIKLLVGLGDIDRARSEAALLQRVSPESAARLSAGLSLMRRPEDRERDIRYFRIAFASSTTDAIDGSTPEAPGHALALPDKPSIAVLPFTNMSGDPEQEYFTDGISEDIVTELSRFHSLFVIAWSSCRAYRNSNGDAQTIARELGVQYLL